jgi:hypothetical protein
MNKPYIYFFLDWFFEICKTYINYEKSNLKQLNELKNRYNNAKDFYEYVRIKYELRKWFLNWSAFNNLNYWISGDPLNNTSFYARTTKSKIEERFEQNFISEFISPFLSNKNYYFCFTNSGMSSINLALHLNLYFNNKSEIYVQNDSYYEIYPIVKTLYKNIYHVNINDIYKLLKSDTDISCIFVGYTKNNKDNIINIEKLMRLLSLHNQKSIMFVIIDRTFFSLCDDFYYIINNIKFNPNIVLISTESLLKHYEYGLDLANLGACFIYSSLCNKKIFFNIIKLLFESLSCRPELNVFYRILPFNKQLLYKEYEIHKYNASIFNDMLKKYNFINISMQYGELINNADILYLPVKNYELSCDLVEKITNETSVIQGQSFGFDITRVCSELNFYNHKAFLRFSIGLEEKDQIELICESINKIFDSNHKMII